MTATSGWGERSRRDVPFIIELNPENDQTTEEVEQPDDGVAWEGPMPFMANCDSLVVTGLDLAENRALPL